MTIIARIIDGHHHIWRQADLPWLRGPMQPRIFGPYEAIRRDYPIEEYLADIEGQGVGKSVYVQTNWAPEDGEREAQWVQETAGRTGWPHAIVAFADLTVPDARPALERLARIPLVRGIRQQLHWHHNPQYSFAARADLCDDPALQRNVAALAGFGFSFDLQVFAGQMAGAGRLADACPQVTFVLQHAGMPEDLSPEGYAFWKEQLAGLARRPNVVTKLSAFGTFVHRNDPALIARILTEAVAIFGADRCLFGSNFPVEKLWTGYSDLLAAFRAAAASLPDAAQQAIFHDTAARVYRL